MPMSDIIAFTGQAPEIPTEILVNAGPIIDTKPPVDFDLERSLAEDSTVYVTRIQAEVA